MTAKISFTRFYEDTKVLDDFIIKGKTVKEIRRKADIELKKRNLDIVKNHVYSIIIDE